MSEHLQPNPYPYPNVHQQPTPPPRKRRRWPLVAIGIVVGLCALGGIAISSGADAPATPLAPADVTDTPAGEPAAKPVATGTRFTAAHIRLTVKTIKKDCFGSAGCNVQYSIRLATKSGVKVPDECDVTYEVAGLEDPQIGTLTLTGDGRYTQDDYQTGETRRSSTKLTAKVTSLECD